MPVAVITGASSGIGRALYEHVQNWMKYTVIGVSRHGSDLDIDLTATNLSDYSRISHPVTSAVNKASTHGGLDLLINCAGIMDLPESPHARNIFDLNFWGAFWLSHALIPNLERAKGCVINIASVVGTTPDPHLPIYCASKAALISITRSMAACYAPNIRFNAISPGFVRTNLVPDQDTPLHLIDRIPMGYEAEPTELCELVETIATTRYCTGANFVIDGGLSCKG